MKLTFYRTQAFGWPAKNHTIKVEPSATSCNLLAVDLIWPQHLLLVVQLLQVFILISFSHPPGYLEKKSPEVVATSLISAFPGESLAAKSSNILLTASIAAFLVSKEIYLVDGEFFEMLCIFGAYYVWFSGGKETAAAYFADRQSVS